MSRIVVDELDRRLLDALQDDCARSNQTLAHDVGTSPATCLRRVKRLVDEGIVERRIAIVAPDAARQAGIAGLAPGITAVIEVTLDRQAVEHLAVFEERAVADADVQQCYRVTPGPDFVLIAYVRDTDAYQRLAERLFTGEANVRNVKTYFSTRRSKFEPRIPVVASEVARDAAAPGSATAGSTPFG